MIPRLSRIALALFALASATTILAFAPASAFAAKNASPPAAKTTIMGTPAQLVEDLLAAGIDLAHSRFTKPELLSKATRNMYASGLWDYHFINIKLTFAEADGTFEGFEAEYPRVKIGRGERAKPPTRSYPLGQFQSILSGKFENLAVRYGSKYALPDETVSWNEVTYWLWAPESKVLWGVNFSGLEGKGVERVWCYRIEGVETISYLPDGTIQSSHPGTKKLFADLAKCGLAIEAPDNNLKALGKGRILSDEPPLFFYTSVRTISIQFKNGAVRLEMDMDKVNAFYIHNMREPWSWGLEKHLERFFSKDAVLDMGDFGEAFNSGVKAVEKRYGPSYFPCLTDNGGFVTFDTIVSSRNRVKYIVFNLSTEYPFSWISGNIEAAAVYSI